MSRTNLGVFVFLNYTHCLNELELIYTVFAGRRRVPRPSVFPSICSPCATFSSVGQWFCPLTIRRSRDSKAGCFRGVQLQLCRVCIFACFVLAQYYSLLPFIFPFFFFFLPTLLDLFFPAHPERCAHLSRSQRCCRPGGRSGCARGALGDAQEQCRGVRRLVKIAWESDTLITQDGAEQSPVVKIISSQ